MSYPVLYLDFDGVLHHEEVWRHPKRGIYIPQHVAPGRTLFEWSFYLEQALAPFPSVRIVLSTSWVCERSFNFARKQLTPVLQQRVVGATFHRRLHIKRDFADMSRGMQIWSDVVRRCPSGWVALDDDTFGWPAWCRDKLVQCYGPAGLSDKLTRGALARALARIADPVPG